MLDNVQVPGRERARHDRRRPQGRVQHPQPRTREAGHPQHRRRQAGAQSRRGLREGSAAVRPRHLRVRPHQAEARPRWPCAASSATPWSIARSATSIAPSRPCAPDDSAARAENDRGVCRRVLDQQGLDERGARAMRSTRPCRCSAATATRASFRSSVRTGTRASRASTRGPTRSIASSSPRGCSSSRPRSSRAASARQAAGRRRQPEMAGRRRAAGRGARAARVAKRARGGGARVCSGRVWRQPQGRTGDRSATPPTSSPRSTPSRAPRARREAVGQPRRGSRLGGVGVADRAL